MIRSSALLIAVALGLLAAGVFASSLELVYVSIGVGILAAVALSAGVILRRGEIFGAARQDTAADWPAADVTAVPAMADGRNGAARDDRKAGDRANGARRATPAVAEASPGREPDAGSTDGGLSWARRADREAAPPGRDTDQGASRGEREGARSRQDKDRAAARPDRAAAASAWDRGPAGQGKDQAPSRGSREEAGSGQGQDRAASWQDRPAGPGRDRGLAASRPDREEAAPGRDTERAAASWENRDAAPGRDREAAAAEWPEGFRVPPFGDRRAGKPGDVRPAGAGPRRETPAQATGSPAGEELWNRGGEELADSGRPDPARPAWPATAGPRAMGTGATARYPLAETRDSETSVSRGAGDLFTPRRSRIQEGTREVTGAEDTTGTGGGKDSGGAGIPRAADLVPVPGDAGDESATDAAAEEKTTAGDRSADDVGAKDKPADDSGAEGPAAAEGRTAAEDSTAGDRTAGRDRAATEDAAAEVEATQDRATEDRATEDEATQDGATEDEATQDRATQDEATQDGSAAQDAATEVGATEDAGESRDAGEATRTGRAPDEDAQDTDLRGTGSARERQQAKDSGKAGPAGRDGSPGTAAAAPEQTPAPADDRDEKRGKPGAEDQDSSAATPVDGEVTVVPGVSRYHRRGCILIRFLSDGDLEIMTRGRAEAAGSVPCKACQPDKPVAD